MLYNSYKDGEMFLLVLAHPGHRG